MLFFIFSLATRFAFAESSVGSSIKDIDQALTSGASGAMFHAELKPGFHFNEKAPNSLTVDGAHIKPTSLDKRKVEFRFPKPAYAHAQAMVYICDDQLTFCVPKSIEIKNDGATNSSKEKSPAKVSKPKAQVKINSFGFIADDLQSACARAASEHRLVLVDFSARWCPGCVRLESEVFATSDFKNATKDFVKVRLDYDRFENYALKSKFGIYGIPTLILLTPDQQEVSRVVDFQPVPILQKFLHEASLNPQPFSELKAKADSGDTQASKILGLRLYAANRFNESTVYLAKINPSPLELSDARVQSSKEAASRDPGKNGDFLKVTREAIATEPRSSRSIVWRTLLLQKLDPKESEHKRVLDAGVQLADELLKNPQGLAEAVKGDAVGEFTGYEKVFVASERADLIEAAGQNEMANVAAMRVVADVAREARIPVSKSGPSLRYLIFLIAAHEFPEAEVQVRAMLKRDSHNPELKRRLLRVLNEQKKFVEAVAIGRETLPASFGKNEVWVAELLAKAYVGVGKKSDAHKLVISYLNRSDIEWALMQKEQNEFEDLAKASE